MARDLDIHISVHGGYFKMVTNAQGDLAESDKSQQRLAFINALAVAIADVCCIAAENNPLSAVMLSYEAHHTTIRKIDRIFHLNKPFKRRPSND